MKDAMMEVVRIFREGYVDSPIFKEKLLKSLAEKTGNAKFAEICESVIDALPIIKECDKSVTFLKK